MLSFPLENGHIIQNALILQHSIERQVLVADSDAGLRLIRPQSRAQGAAAAIITRCFTVSGDQVYGRKCTVTVIPVNQAPIPRLQRSGSLCVSTPANPTIQMKPGEILTRKIQTDVASQHTLLEPCFSLAI